MTTNSDLLSAVRVLRAENLDALGRSDEAGRIRARLGAPTDPGNKPLDTSSRVVEAFVEDSARAKASDPEGRTASDFSAEQLEEILQVLLPGSSGQLITTVYPRQYRDSKIVVDALKLGNPVLVNLFRVYENDKQRYVDFLSGLAKGDGGEVTRLTDRTYLVTTIKRRNVGPTTVTPLPAFSGDENGAK